MGTTSSSDLPVSDDAVQPTLNGPNGSYYSTFTATGAPLAASFLPGEAAAVAFSAGRLCVFGTIRSDDLSPTAGAFQSSRKGPANSFLMILEMAEKK